MKCPIDGAVLVMTERNGVEIDYCPHCRGVWLDRGELEKIIDRSTQSAPAPAPARQGYRDDGYHDGYDTPRRHMSGKPRKSRAESFLGELFDF